MRNIISVFLLLFLTLHPVWADNDSSFNPATPAEPAQKARVTVTVSPTGAGTASGGGTYDVGARVNLRTSSNGSQWKFSCWKNASTGEVVSTSTSFYVTTAYGGSQYVAEYEELPITRLQLLCNPSETSASLSGSGNYLQGARVYVTAGTKTNYTFVNWMNKRTGAVASTSRSFYFTKTSEADTLIANYNFTPGTPGEPSKVIVYHNVTVGVNDATMGRVSTAGGKVEEGKTFSVSAYNNANYAFLGWQVDGAIIATTPTYTLTMGKRDVKLTAIFEFAPGTPDEPNMSDKQPTEPEEPENPEEPEEPTEPEEPEHTGPSTILGDVNGDWRVNVLDHSMLNGYILGNRFDTFIFGNADINHDGRINAIDGALLLGIIITNIIEE